MTARCQHRHLPRRKGGEPVVINHQTRDKIVKLARELDFLSIGTNDLTQYTLAVDRGNEWLDDWYNPLHPAVLRLVAETIAECTRQGKGVSVCGEMAGDVAMTRLLLGLGLRSFSMHPAQILAVKQEVLRADITKLQSWAQGLLLDEEPSLALPEH